MTQAVLKPHHYVELENADGSRTVLDFKDFLVGLCQGCARHVLAVCRYGAMSCPHCTSLHVDWSWVRPRMVFVSEAQPAPMGASTHPLFK